MVEQVVKVEGAHLVVEICGEGDGEAAPLVLVHGDAGDRRAWDGLWRALASRRRVIRYDLRGYGQSVDHDRRPFRHARDLAALLDALGLETADVLGASRGGAIALNFALDFPDRVRRLVLASPGLVAWEWSQDWRAAHAAIVAAARGGDLARARELWFGHPLFATARAIPAAAEALRAEIWAYSGDHWVQGDNEEMRLPDLDRLPELAVPTLLLSGEADLADFRLIADLTAAAAPDVRRLDYAGAGHMLHIERPERFVADVCAFLDA